MTPELDQDVDEQKGPIQPPPSERVMCSGSVGVEIVELSLEDVVRNGYGVWQSPAVLAEVGPANVKIVKMNRGSGGAITEIELNGSTHTLVRRKDGAILKFGAPPASAVRGNIYQSPAEIRSAITASGPASRR